MIAVAGVALLFGVFVTWRRAAYFMRVAAAHEDIARLLRSSGTLADQKHGR
jgi:hypothetical protein